MSDNRQRFEVLMKQVKVPLKLRDNFFQDGWIERVECSRSNQEWIIYIGKSSILPVEAYRTFCLQVQNKLSHIAKIKIIFCYVTELPHANIVATYWGLFIEWVKRKVVSVNGWLHKAQYTVNQDLINLSLPDETSLELAKKKQIDKYCMKFFHIYFRRSLRVAMQLGDTDCGMREAFQQRLIKERQQAVQQLIEGAAYGETLKEEGTTSIPLQVGYPIKDDPTPIMNIQDERKRVTIQGSVFGCKVRELRNGNTLFTFNLTDFSDSMMHKIFAKTKEDIRMFNLIKDGKWLKTCGRVEYDRFMAVPELVMMPSDLSEIQAPATRQDKAEMKRIEFHLHSTMSTMDAVTSISDYVDQAAKWGHKAIAIADHGNVQGYPEAAKAAKRNGIKMIYGLEAYVVNDNMEVVLNADDRSLHNAVYTIFDIETTGLSVTHNKIIEIAVIKLQNGEEVDRFSTFVNPHMRIPYNIQQLTNITDEMVADAPEIELVLPKFVEFVGNSILVAHNARFDIGFIQYNLQQADMPKIVNPVLDTLELARLLHPSLKNHRLNTLADKYKVLLGSHHRAIDDTIALSGVLNGLLRDAQQLIGVKTLGRMNDYVGQNLQNARPFHCGIYALNAVGKKNLYKLVSMSHTEYFKRVACIPKSKLVSMREGLLIMSGCDKGEFFETVLNKSIEEAEQVAQFYDVLEIQPLTMYMHLIDKGLVGSTTEIEDVLRKIVKIGEEQHKPIIATGNVHYLNPCDKLFRDITIHGMTGFNPLKDIRKPDAHFRTTDEMLQEFAFLGKEQAFQFVVVNTNALMERFENFDLFPKQLFTPNIEGADQEIRDKCYNMAKKIYGEPLPDIIIKRLEKELNPIIAYGFSVNYLIAERLVKKSNEDGYLVGSRGSVGSSVVATFLGVSEVNPLPPHYICWNKRCKYSEWFTDGHIASGFDLQNKECPKCGHMIKGEGQNIPFETFLGFKGDKVPDIDLNFSGNYQPVAHNYTKVLFGEKNVFRAGTIGTVAEKTAYGFAKKYAEDHGKRWRGAELSRIATSCTGVKRSTGQHPGGIVVIPDYMEMEDVTPVQYPADDTGAEWKTTHFDYHAFEDNLLKLDILGHDDPTIMRMLQDLTGIEPTTIPMNDPRVMSLFNSTGELGVSPQQIRTPVATYGIPEMGTRFVRQMLVEAQPSTFADLLQISGLSHGTGVWLGNAQELIKNKICTIKTVIGCRDEIMLYLIDKAGMDASLAFNITESLRKGKGLTADWIQKMRSCNVPEWYINSCLKIQYMFPKAHAAAYVISAVRTAYFKLYCPIEFYATYFTVRVEDFDITLCCQGYEALNKKLDEIEAKGVQATTKEKAMIPTLEMAIEMTARGFSFKPIDLYRSEATKFLFDKNSLIFPFSAVQGIGDNAARNIIASREDGEYLSIEDFQIRSKATKSIVELLNQIGCFRGLPETNQLSLF